MSAIAALNLQTMFVGRHSFCYEVIDSTNLELRRLAEGKPSVAGNRQRPDLPEGAVVIADFQTRGRGQQQRVWHSEAGKNLLLSVLLYPRFLGPSQQFALNEAVSLALYDAVSPEFEAGELHIKWPNDLLIRSRKVAGILIENSLSAASSGKTGEIRRSFIGLGLNVEQTKFPPELPRATSLWREGAKVSRQALLERFLTALEQRYLQLRRGDFAGLRKAYLRALFRYEEWASYKSKDGHIFRGRIRGLEPMGRLLIEKEEGGVEAFDFKEVEFL